MAKITYHERSWEIDVISEINLHLANKTKPKCSNRPKQNNFFLHFKRKY